MTNELNPAQGSVADKKDLLVKDIGVVVGDAGDLIKASAQSTMNSVNATATELAAARSKLADNLRREKDRLAEAGAHAMEKVKCTAQATDGYVKQHPWPIIGAAAAAGIVAGIFLSRR